MEGKKLVVILHETVAQSWMRDLGSFGMALALVGVGWWAGSAALQWVGAIVFFLLMFAKKGGIALRLTPQEAADHLWDRFGVTAVGRSEAPPPPRPDH